MMRISLELDADAAGAAGAAGGAAVAAAGAAGIFKTCLISQTQADAHTLSPLPPSLRAHTVVILG